MTGLALLLVRLVEMTMDESTAKVIPSEGTTELANGVRQSHALSVSLFNMAGAWKVH